MPEILKQTKTLQGPMGTIAVVSIVVPKDARVPRLEVVIGSRTSGNWVYGFAHWRWYKHEAGIQRAYRSLKTFDKAHQWWSNALKW